MFPTFPDGDVLSDCAAKDCSVFIRIPQVIMMHDEKRWQRRRPYDVPYFLMVRIFIENTRIWKGKVQKRKLMERNADRHDGSHHDAVMAMSGSVLPPFISCPAW
ncbi:hypothetical protein CFR72_11765 [Gluconacetobacter entanii]|uniref:Uncharacterized protein n=1 Tax=Gluconacetobacter entanii TaxID=108528 RepID=A0A318PPY2_9PROT|nr:hypothetical protein CFR72_11765 [Gluconacetobacter entanii]